MNSEQQTSFGFRITQIYLALLFGFGGIALALLFWIVIRGPSILERADNPRLVTAELGIRRGQILDARDLPLATTVERQDGLDRFYPLSELTGPAVGYYSLRLGQAGIEAAYNDLLRGTESDAWRDYWQYEVLQMQRQGHDVRLTIDQRWQQEASMLLESEAGAIILLTVPEADILAMASRPGYDPNRLEATFETLVNSEDAPLLNRATQGQYPPGLILQPFLLATASEQDLVDLGLPPAQALPPAMITKSQFECVAQLNEETTWSQLLASRCSGLSLALGELLGLDGVSRSLDRFQFFSVPDIDIAAESMDSSALEKLQAAVQGQGGVAVSPMQAALAITALANDGVTPAPRLVRATQDRDGNWQPSSIEPSGTEAISAQSARRVLELLPDRQGVLEVVSQVGSESQQTGPAWYLGMAPASNPRFAVVALLEEQTGTEMVSTTGRQLLMKVLNPDG